MRFSSIRTKLMIAMAATAVAAGGLLGAYLIWSSYRALREQAQTAQLAMARNLANQVDHGVSQAFQAVAVLATRKDVIHMERGALLSELDLVTSATELLDALLVVLPSGAIYAQSRPEISPACLPPKSVLKSQIDKVKGLHEAVLTDIYRTADGEPVVSIRAPIFRGKEFVGSLVGVLRFSVHSIWSLELGKTSKEGYSYLVSDDGVALVHPNREKLLQDISDNPAVNEAMHHNEGIIHFSPAGGPEVMAAFAKVETAGWSVVVRQPVSECYAPALRMLKVSSLLMAMALLAAALMAAELARRLSRPLLALTEQVRRVEAEEEEGNSLRQGAGGDEIGDLARTLADMAERLKLQRKGRERAHLRALAAEKKLSESERLASLGQLAAGVAHELNNPLTVIQGAAQVLPRSQGEAQLRWIREILKETRRCKRLVGDLLNFAKPIQLTLQRSDLRKLCHEAWEQARMSSGRKAKLEISGRAPLAVVDPERFKQVLINLFSNALDANSSRGKIKARIHAEGGLLSIEVSDQGPGLGAQDAESLFRPFFTTKADGTGLGLPIARAVMQAHGGRLWAEPAAAGGAHFIAQWPAKPALRRPNKKAA